ncbi:MAG: efflux RND transporter periplasmic adaptor subunit [bacterium]|nr:MAG: efflux RND transporter periplasmic adaptor subunit [bacterium]
MIVGQKTEFVVHLTRLADFGPLNEGNVTVQLDDGSGEGLEVTSEAPLRKGIWKVEVPVSKAGEYHLRIICRTPILSEVFEIGHVKAWATLEDLELAEGHSEEIVDHGHDEADHEGGEGGITFLKEQQWNTEFGVEPVRLVTMHSSIPAIAEVLPRQQGYADVVTPVEGFINVLHNQDMATPGRRVESGERLLAVCPPLEGTGSWTERHLGYMRAKREFERAERLLQRDAIAKRDYEEIRQKYLVERSSYEMILKGSSAEPVEVEETGEVHLELKAPISGIVSVVDVVPGQTITAGQKLMTIIDPAAVWLRASLFERDYYRIGNPEGAMIVIPGRDASLLIGKNDLKIVSKGELFDRSSRTIPIIFETDNPGGLLKIGQIVQMEIYTSEAINSIAVREECIIDEDYVTYVFVQIGGESFEKRLVKTGARARGMVAILEGLTEDERVVTIGAYSVKLASTSKDIGHPHVH